MTFATILSGFRRNMLGYVPIGGDHMSVQSHSRHQRRAASSLLFLATASVSCICGIIIGILYSEHSQHSFNRDCAILQQPRLGSNIVPDIGLESYITSFSYNRTFGEDPLIDDATDAAWESVVPRKCLLFYMKYITDILQLIATLNSQ
jgi:hypothetical protein